MANRIDKTGPRLDADNVTYGDVAGLAGGPLSAIREQDRTLARRGAQILGAALRAEGVQTLFGYPGGANLEIFDVLHEFDIRCVRVEHEQGAVHAAEGFARATGRVGVCLATSGPGACNLVTGIADAFSDSVPVVAITGNVPTWLLGKNAFQEADIVEITRPITKKSMLVREVSRIPAAVREAFALAAGNRPGPVLIDIPKDVQQHFPHDGSGRYQHPRIPASIQAPEPVVRGMTPVELDACLRMIANARRPVIYAGGGIISANASDLLTGLARRMGCPVTTTIMGLGAFPPDDRLWLQVLGMHGSKAANVAVNEADLVIAIGVRFDDRVTGKVSEFIKQGRIIHIDIDHRELNKNKSVTLPIHADLRIALDQLAAEVPAGDHGDWLRYLDGLKRDFPLVPPEAQVLTGPKAIALLSDMTSGDALLTLGVGQHQMWAMQHYRVQKPRAFLSSSGFGTMGFGLPAAIGAKVGCPKRTVIDVDGDGSLNMTIHELSTCHRYGLGVKVVCINNQWLGMVRQWQDMIYSGHRAESALSDPMAVKNPGDTDVYPDFVRIAEGYRVKAERVQRPEHLADAYRRMLADPDEPYLVDVIVRSEDNVYPMIPAGGTYRDIIMSADDCRR
ncbi:MAG TPA: biosynthetic-type acetolactate synthase large subunit [Gammaproteobacteria bacterium]